MVWCREKGKEKKGKYKRREQERKREPNPKERIEQSKLLAGQTDWASECRAIPVVRKGGNISLSLHISCAGWDTKQLMAFAAITYLHLPLHSHLDPSPTEHFLLSSWNTHAILTHHSNDEALLSPPLSRPLFNLFPHIHPALLHFTSEAWAPVNPDEPGSFTLKKHRETIEGFRLQISVWIWPSLFLVFFPDWVTICRDEISE